jgi:hypothetical protein
MKFRAALTIFILFSYAPAYNQVFLPLNNDFNYYIQQAVTYNNQFHSAIRPYNLEGLILDTSKLQPLLNYSFFNQNNKISVLPIVESSLLVSDKKNHYVGLSAGAAMKFKFGERWYLQVNVFENLDQFPPFINEKIDSNKVVPHYGRYMANFGSFYSIPQINGFLNYSASQYISLAVGQDKFFLGDGYRSLFLSDNSAPFPFARLVVQAWRIKYLAMLAKIDDVESYSGNSSFQEKFAVMHFLSYNITDRINIGFFEAIIWRGRDTATDRGVELNYLNPVIYFRPVEFSMNSPDNANIGGSFKFRVFSRTFIYGQLFLDDFIVKEFRANKGWWGNKYGIQGGIKSFGAFGINNLFMQAEINTVQPYTYSHESSLTNYGHYYQPLAHPLGANFRELIGIARYNKGKWALTEKAIAARYGEDFNNISYGMDIYKTYNLIQGPYGNKIEQGLKTNSFINETSIGYILKPSWNMNISAGYRYNYKKNLNEFQSDNYFFIAISTLLYNNDVDY